MNQGRFDLPYEFKDITKGIQVELTNTIGSTCAWWVYNAAATTRDPIYDVGDYGTRAGGRQWFPPVIIPLFSAVWTHGTELQNDRGFYNTDNIHFSFNSEDAVAAVPDLFLAPDEHVRDRVVYRGQVYKPTNLQPRGLLNEQYLLSSVLCQQVMSDEMVNDFQFQAYAQ